MKILVPAVRGKIRLCVLPKIRYLNFADNDVGPDGVSALNSAIPSLNRLVTLDLSQNRLSSALNIIDLKSSKGKAQKNALFRQVGWKMSIAGGEARKLALMAREDGRDGAGEQVECIPLHLLLLLYFYYSHAWR
ncbi:hypothetical protein T484DRAFT_1768520 [Baffinella frigidus]|nr:hypothetical protein T484DRAFT_1768520 [Cryptophyta sp. CCMP2293]